MKKPISSKPNEIRRVVTVPFDPHWQIQFAKEAELLKKIFKGEAIAIHHIGSTSIPGMQAKPIIDILMVVRNIQQVDAFNASMERNGYTPEGEFGIDGRRYFFKGSNKLHTHHLHVFQKRSSHIARHLNFRDYLIAHPKEAKQYSQLKIELANRHPTDINAYMNGKDSFMKRMEGKANEWVKDRPPFKTNAPEKKIV